MVALRRSESSDFARLRHLLSKRVRSRLIDRLSLPVTASAADVLKEALRIGERLERQMEEQIVNDLIIGDDKHHPFTLGLERTRARVVRRTDLAHGLCSGLQARRRPVLSMRDAVRCIRRQL